MRSPQSKPPPSIPSNGEPKQEQEPAGHEEGLSDIVEIDPDGDIVLSIAHESSAPGTAYSFRAKSSLLQSKSKYFAGLLQGRFGESERIAQTHRKLREVHGTVENAPARELPVIHIEDVGRISAVKSIQPLCTDFLSILHDRDIQPATPVSNLANLAIVSDRFDALAAVQAYVRRKRLIRAIDGKTTAKMDTGLSEERVRQRLLVSSLLDYPAWTEKYSTRIIMKGWVARDVSDSQPLWWDLPARFEEELAYRRDCVLETIQSVQTHFVALYASRERQCKLGYDSSAQCDSFQLGEMIRFLSRIGTLHLQGVIFDTTDPPPPFEGDIHILLESLRQVPEYQIDRNHAHCGLRTRITPILDILLECLQHVGICSDCWSQNRAEHAWMEKKRPLVWRRQSLQLRAGHKEMHASVRALFTAAERDWSC
ncbi:unnamed protein product [Zymoseptoria tritici ST99CH_3D1]|nr:unnamed protein product [Zymoseptoria tritici ST99CH_3D1]